jgi:hypothetical protein
VVADLTVIGKDNNQYLMSAAQPTPLTMAESNPCLNVIILGILKQKPGIWLHCWKDNPKIKQGEAIHILQAQL